MTPLAVILVVVLAFALGVVTGMWLLSEILFPSGFWKIFTLSPKGK